MMSAILPSSAIVTLPADENQAIARVPEAGRTAIRRFAPAIVVVALVALAYGLDLHRNISFETLIRNRAEIDHFIAQNRATAVAGYIALYIVAVSLSLPGGVVLSVTGGFLFGIVIGSAAAMLGALVGATIIFLIARSAAGEWLTQRAGPFATRLAEGFRTHAFSYLLFLRLVPFPFWLVNLAPALFGVRLSTYVAATAIGIIPATVTLVVFGAGLESVFAVQEAQYNACLAAGRDNCSVDFNLSHVLTPTLLGALAAIGALALIPAFVRRLWGRKHGLDFPPRKL